MNHSNFYRTYGNLVINIGVNTNRVSLTAKDFALPLLSETGATLVARAKYAEDRTLTRQIL